MNTSGRTKNRIDFQLPEVSPYFSVVLIRNEKAFQPDIQKYFLEYWVNEELAQYPKENMCTIKHIDVGEYPLNDTQVVFTILYYSERKAASWTRQPDIRDYINQVVIMTSLAEFSVLYFSNNELKGSFIRFLQEQESQDLWPRTIERNRLNAIFIKGPARTLWLTGIHQRRSIRADSKTLMGSNLRDALNPLDDQSYYFTSARCYQKDWDKTTGVSPSKSQIWLRKTQNWDDYCDLVNEVLSRLKDKYEQSIESPFSILAIPLKTLDQVRSAYDLNFLYPETSAEDAIDEDQDTIKLLEDLSYNTDFDVKGDTASPNLNAKIFYKGNNLGEIAIEFDQKSMNNQAWNFVFTPKTDIQKINPSLVKTPNLIRDGKYLQIRYESGHTFSGGDFYLQRFMDLSFDGWKFEDFDGYSADKEKPSRGNLIGKDRSLFCWIWNKYSDNSWVYCDDRSGEVADFVKFEIINGVPKLSLIHVKAAHGTANRNFSVSAYEVVTAQAIKNLRHFEIENLINQFQKENDEHFLYRIKRFGLAPKDAAEAGQFKNEFIDVLRAHSANLQREVIVLQPHNRQSSISGGKGNNNAQRQLHTLLLSAETSCKSLGAKFYVITDKG